MNKFGTREIHEQPKRTSGSSSYKQDLARGLFGPFVVRYKMANADAREEGEVWGEGGGGQRETPQSYER